MEVDFAKMAIPDDVKEFTKNWEAGIYDHATKLFWQHVIEERAEKARKPGESPQQTYTRLIVSDPAGRALFKAHHRAPAGSDTPEVEAARPQHIGLAAALSPRRQSTRRKTSSRRRISRALAIIAAPLRANPLNRNCKRSLLHIIAPILKCLTSDMKVLFENPVIAKRAREERLATLGVV